jgi:hypothetical protein
MPARHHMLPPLLAAAGILALTGPAIGVPDGYRLVWSDRLTWLSLRTGGPTSDGQILGSGTWAAPGAWYSIDPRGVAGYGYDWFVDPTYAGWPAGYQGQFAITDEGLRIRAEAPPLGMKALLPTVRGVTPWISGQVNSYYAVRITPPFYFEARAKMPAGVGRPFPAIWLVTGAHHRSTDTGKEYEIDVHEGFGDSDRLHSTIHWSTSPIKRDYPAKTVVDMPSGIDLSTTFNTWGCHVTEERQTIFFNGREVGRIETPDAANADQPFGIVLDVSAGIPWKGGGPPSDGPHDMVVRYVMLYAPNTRGLTLR